jgi:hypothetical protein
MAGANPNHVDRGNQGHDTQQDELQSRRHKMPGVGVDVHAAFFGLRIL